MSDGGKGSKPRPFSISQQEYDNRWDHIFSRDLKPEVVKTETNEDGEKLMGLPLVVGIKESVKND
jgi:hypothetical protein